MVNGCPFLVQVTVVAGEPVVVQFRVDNENDDSAVNDTTLGTAGEIYKFVVFRKYPTIYMSITHC